MNNRHKNLFVIICIGAGLLLIFLMGLKFFVEIFERDVVHA